MDKEVKVTKHAKQRMKQRNGFNKDTSNRMAKKALEEGVSHKETTGQLNKWMTKIFFQNTRANNCKLYGDKIYIFNDTVLITVFSIPNNLKAAAKKAQKRKKLKNIEK